MTVDFETMGAAGWSALEEAMHAESQGMSRLEAFKAILTRGSVEPFAVEHMARYGSGYPSRAAQAAATIGLAAVVLAYPRASCDEVAAFERETGLSRKVDALARADRADDALRFYDRLDPDSLRLQPISLVEARDVALSQRTGSAPQLSVVIDPVEQHPWGWVFSSHLPTSRLADRAGARPVMVDRFTGAAIELDGLAPIATYVGRYEETGWPFPMAAAGRSEPGGSGGA